MTPQAGDVEGLETLALLHKIAGFALGFLSLCGAVFLVSGLRVLLGVGPRPTGSLSPTTTGAMFTVGGGGLTALLVSLSVGCFLSSGWIRRREFRGRVFAIDCALLFVTPLGALLGIYGLVLLSKPHVRAAFRT